MAIIPPFPGVATAESVNAELSEGVLYSVTVLNNLQTAFIYDAPYLEIYLNRGGTEPENRVATLCRGISSSTLSPSWHGILETRAGDLLLARARGTLLTQIVISYLQLTTTGETPLSKYVRYL